MLHADPLLAHIIKVACKYPCVLGCRLFGSRAKGSASAQSDYDIAVDWEGELGLSWGSFANEVIEEKPLLNSVDLVNLQLVSTELRSRIEREGVLFYDKK